MNGVACAVLGATSVFALGLALLLEAPPDAAACGVVAAAPERIPSLAHEQVLLIFDPQTDTEHFIRQVSFKRAETPFGFIVPTPSRPTVQKVGKAPFNTLRHAYPFEGPKVPNAHTWGAGSGIGTIGNGVTVLEVSKVGSFTAFVLEATNVNDLKEWLTKNAFNPTPGFEAWIEHYVRMGFYYVAMRYEPPRFDPGEGLGKLDDPPSKDAVLSETVRITFQTPLPYYPYFEPLAPKEAAAGERLLDLWLVTNQEMLPLAFQGGADPAWVQPFRAGAVYGRDANVALVIDPEFHGLLPGGNVIVQTFQDQKSARVGFGDVLFVTRAPTEFSPLERDKLRPLLGIVDPGLVPAGR